MNRDEIESIRQIADLHEQRINQALKKLQGLFPLTAIKIPALTEEQLFAIEVLTSRFSKLQDYLGNRVFDALFELEGENTVTWTPIDKLHKLEQYGLISDSHLWRDMRKSRNFLTHEYPNEPEIIAASLNRIYDFLPALLEIKNTILTKIFKDLDSTR